MANDDLQGHLILHLEGLDQRREIGHGAYGAVYEVKMNGLPCVAKGLHQILLGMGGYERVGEKDVETIRAKFLQECSLLSKLKHPNIVQFLGIHHTKEKDVLLVMEYMHMDLAKCLDTHPDIPLPLKLSILLDVSNGLLHLHSQNPPIIQRDLTAANVLLTEGLRAKIADLGVSKISDLQQIPRASYTTVPGAHAYMPPEALSPKPQYDTKLDSFSFGVLSLYTANQEFPSVHEPPMTTTIVRMKEVHIFKRKHWIDKMGERHTLYPLVIRCLQDLSDQRPSAKKLSDMLSDLCTQHPMKWNTILEYRKIFESCTAELAKWRGGEAKGSQAEHQQTFNKDFRDERDDRSKTAAESHELVEQLKQHKAEWEESKAKMQLDIDDLRKRNEGLQSSEEMIHHLKSKLEEISQTDSSKIENTKRSRDKTEQIQTQRKEIKLLTQELEDTKKSLTEQTKTLNSELEAAKEELAVKVAQVKQYQKQVEDYKQAQLKNTFEKLYNEEKDINAHLMEESDGLKKIIAQLTNGSSPRREGERSFSSLDPSPQPLKNHPISSASEASEGPAHPHISHDMSPPVTPKAYYPAKQLPLETEASQYHNAETKVMTPPVDIPFDLDLVCPKCRRIFRKGEMQLYKQHLELCLPNPCK